MQGFLYIIKNNVNNKVYIGKTYKSLSERFKAHISEHKIKDRPLYRAMRKYGIENFYIENLGSYSENELELAEIEAIQFYNSYEKGYNATKGGDGKRYLKVSDDEILKAYNITQNKAEVARQLKISLPSIERVLVDINTSKGKPLKLLELNIEFKNTTEAALFLIEAECTRSKNMRSVQSEISKAIKYNRKCLGFTFISNKNV